MSVLHDVQPSNLYTRDQIAQHLEIAMPSFFLRQQQLREERLEDQNPPSSAAAAMKPVKHRAIFATPTPEMTYATNTRNDARTGPSLRSDNEFLR
nr:hypothetical protein Itr_chr09CG17460 [Ipomoea trifida]